VAVFGALGDIHGDFASARRIMTRHADVPFWLCVGDVADDDGRYESLPAALYWIKGNNENFDAIASGDLPSSLHFLTNGQLSTIGDALRVAALGGTFAPTVYETPPSELPHPKKSSAKATAVADRRRHFVRAEVDACRALRDVDVFMTHEAARPYFAGSGPRRNDAGKTPINEVLTAMQPRLHLFGHHHRFSEERRQGVRSVGLDLVGRSYILIDARSLDLELRQTDSV